jgi:cardiolipin synthase
VFRPLRQVPNLISLIRIALIPPIAAALVQGELRIAMLMIFVAAASDGVDGFLARRFGWQTELGAILDPAADKLLMATVFVTLAVLGGVPLWLMSAAVGRDALIVAGTLAYRYWIGPISIRPTVISKINTLCQLNFILYVVARLQFPVLPAWPATLLGALVLVTVVVSGMDYVLTYSMRAQAEARAKRGAALGCSRQSP